MGVIDANHRGGGPLQARAKVDSDNRLVANALETASALRVHSYAAEPAAILRAMLQRCTSLGPS
jgi:hypothetical protein